MNFKYSFKRFFSFRYYIYLVATFLSIVAICLIINFASKPTKEQSYLVFIANEPSNTKVVNLENKIKELSSYQIKEIDIRVINPKSNMFNNVYYTVGVNADLMILPKSVIYELDTQFYLDLPNEYISETNYKTSNGVARGIRIKDNEKSYYSDYITYGDEEYYLFMNKSSCHLLPYKNDATTNVTSLLLKDIFK